VAVLLLSIALLAPVSNAAATNIAYNIVDYPLNEGVVSGTGADRISGTIITDGAIGPITATDIVGGTFTFTDPAGKVITGTATFGSPIHLQATATQLLLSSSFSFSISAQQRPPGTTDEIDTASVQYTNDSSGGMYYGDLAADTPVHVVESSFNATPVSTSPGSIGARPDWVIAAVPEPSSITILCAAVLALGILRLRRRSLSPTPD
jgi:hypothetical protein